MKILNLKVNHFGKLRNKEIHLKDGINIIYGKNESGKSTLLKFIIGMFYGVSKNKNGKFISDYERYTPWDGEEFSGKISYKLDDGQKYDVFREFKKKNPIIYNENFEDISNTFNIDKTTGNKFFHDQTKVDEELFLSTIVSLQEEVKLNEKEQNTLIQKMSNLASTGEDNVSFQKIIAKLNKKQIEEIGTSRSQDRPINIITKRMEEIQNEKEFLSKYSTKRFEIEEEKKELENQIKEDENKLELLKKVKQLIENQELEKEKVKINENVIKEYEKKIVKLQEKKYDEKQEKNKIENLAKNNILFETIISIILIVLSIISVCFVKIDIISSVLIVLAIVSGIYLGYTQYKIKVKNTSKNTLKNIENSKQENEIEVLNNSIIKLQEEVQETNIKINKKYKEEIERIRNEYIGIIPIRTIDELLSKKAIQFEVSVLQNKLSDDKIKLHTISRDTQVILEKIDKLVELEEEYSVLEEQYESLIKKSELITLVKTEIERAYDIMKKDVTPKFTNNLSQIIQKISSQKYKNIQLDEANGMIVEVDNGNYMVAKNLSIGTIDQLYLALRLGTGQEISQETLPIILDEAFAYWDDVRLENIIKYLGKEFKERQIIVFTCSNREKEILDKLKIEYNYMELI